MRHILMISNACCPEKLGGLERYVDELSGALASQPGLSVTVLAKRTDARWPLDQVDERGVRVVRYDVPGKSDPLFALKYPVAVTRAVRAALRRFPDAVVHGHFAVPMIPVLLSRRPYVYTLHGLVHTELLGERQGSYRLPRGLGAPAVWALRALESALLRRARRVVTLSRFMAVEVRRVAGPLPGVSVIPGGVDTAVFHPPAVARERDCAGRIEWSPSRRLVERTGVLQLVQALPQVRQEFPQVHLTVAGDGLLRRSIEAEIERLGLARSVSMAGRLSGAELAAAYQRADLAVTPSQGVEAFGLATAEALACGTPVLVTPVGANPELVERLGPAFVSAGTSPADLAAAITCLLREPRALNRASLLGSANASRSPAWPAVAARVATEVYP